MNDEILAAILDRADTSDEFFTSGDAHDAIQDLVADVRLARRQRDAYRDVLNAWLSILSDMGKATTGPFPEDWYA